MNSHELIKLCCVTERIERTGKHLLLPRRPALGQKKTKNSFVNSLKNDPLLFVAKTRSRWAEHSRLEKEEGDDEQEGRRK